MATRHIPKTMFAQVTAWEDLVQRLRERSMWWLGLELDHRTWHGNLMLVDRGTHTTRRSGSTSCLLCFVTCHCNEAILDFWEGRCLEVDSSKTKKLRLTVRLFLPCWVACPSFLEWDPPPSLVQWCGPLIHSCVVSLLPSLLRWGVPCCPPSFGEMFLLPLV